MRIRLLAGFLAVLSAACTTTQTGQALPPSADSPTANEPAGQLPANGAPKVRNPLNVEAFPQTPCTMLTAGQARQLGVATSGQQRQGVVAPACSWENGETGARIGIQFETATKRGLTKTYEQRNTYRLFTEIPSIEGYPAVAVSDPQDIENGNCSLWVGVSDDLVFQLRASLSRQGRQGRKDPCQAAQIAAGMALKTMQGKA